MCNEPSKPAVKMPEVLNLNNEVVKMRKEIKRVRALTIRKLTRQIVNLKKKKGNESEVERNLRRAARLLEEIHAMKDLKPDIVTKTALMKNLSFEKVCKDPNATLSERATARIATHPQISKRIQAIKAAVEAFKDERKKPASRERASMPGKPEEDDSIMNVVKLGDSSEEMAVEEGEDDNKEGEGNVQYKDEESGEGIDAAKDSSSPLKENCAVKTGDDMELAASESRLNSPLEVAEGEPEGNLQSHIKPQKSLDMTRKLQDPKIPPVEGKKTQKATENKPEQIHLNSSMEMKCPRVMRKEEEEESDLDSSDDEVEKEYFDDSTEERFRKQSSQSEGSEEEDDFFLGKVSKFKKKKSGPGVGDKGDDKTKVSAVKAGDEGQGQQDSKAVRLESVFCASLSEPKGAHGNCRRRPGSFLKPHRFQNERCDQGRPQKPAPFQNRGSSKDKRLMASKGQNQKGDLSGGRRLQDRGPAFAKSRPGFEKPKDFRVAAGKTSIPSQHGQQPLHPSWEASKRRKEQQAKITAFQGKKIKFDDD
ncbi:hypothetical protein GJAV_G00097890 [Gymnothorax javanicus]|nr:hypothetical protein GJAV_G00097890 [Gymnothorax javanicus]